MGSEFNQTNLEQKDNFVDNKENMCEENCHAWHEYKTKLRYIQNQNWLKGQWLPFIFKFFIL